MTATAASATMREPRLAGQTIVLIGGSAGISGTGARRPGLGLIVSGALSPALPALVANLALQQLM
jgi:hypothetical protein